MECFQIRGVAWAASECDHFQVMSKLNKITRKAHLIQNQMRRNAFTALYFLEGVIS